MARARLRRAVFRRAYSRHRRRREKRNLQAAARTCGRGQGDRDDFLGASRDSADERSRRGDVRRAHYRRVVRKRGDPGAHHAPRDAAREPESGISKTRVQTRFHSMTPQSSDIAAPAKERRTSGIRARIFAPTALQKMLAFASLVLLLIFFSFASPAFMQMDNILGILQATAVNGVLAIASTFVIITGGIDLSVGTLMTFTAVICGVFLTFWHLPMWVGIVAAIATGALCGTVSGTLTAKMKIPPFIATLGMMLLLKGLSLVVSVDKPIYFTDTENFYMISQDSLIAYFLRGVPVPNAVLILFVLAIVSSIALNRTALGRYTFALGSNEEAVRLSGVNVDRWKICIYGVGGAICGIAGLLIASRLNSAQPALGQGYELEAIAAVVIGGTSLSGGSGTILGTIIGAFIMSVLTNGLRIMSVAQEWQIVVTGLIIILAVYADILRRRKG